jgi:hypothetical protein
MNPWRNIIISPDDPEIIKIDKLEKSLGELPADIQKIRELITRFEVCHFKYQTHIKYIKESIENLKPRVDSEKIGAAHLRHGSDVTKNDKTGRSKVGQDYVYELRRWLKEGPKGSKVSKLLGKRDPEKEKLVKLLIARTLYEFEGKSYEELYKEVKDQDLALATASIDVCHYNFPKNIDQALKGIGQLKPVSDFEGCGSFNSEIKAYVEKEFKGLNGQLASMTGVRAWLTASFAKILKEQIGLKKPINPLI